MIFDGQTWLCVKQVWWLILKAIKKNGDWSSSRRCRQVWTTSLTTFQHYRILRMLYNGDEDGPCHPTAFCWKANSSHGGSSSYRSPTPRHSLPSKTRRSNIRISISCFPRISQRPSWCKSVTNTAPGAEDGCDCLVWSAF
jgi:hypothetical protein